MSDELRPVELYTDGACSGNPGPGGWAFILRCGKTGKELEKAGGEPNTTNNRMELMAVIEGLRSLKSPCRVGLFADSQYVLQGMQQWMSGWKSRGWKRRSGGKLAPVKNEDLWRSLDDLMQVHEIEYRHVKGHSGHVENERCDKLAVEAYQRFLPKRA
ncbi:MAG: ribonuclease HI [Planctomycetota bacterium]